MERTDKFKLVLNNDAAKAAFAKYVPGFFEDPRVKMAGILSIQSVVDRIPADQLDDAGREDLLKELDSIPN